MSYQVAVRTLCEFTAKQGDLDQRFTPAPTAQEGIAGHGTVTSRRAPGYQAEISLSGEFGSLLVRGRADGYDPSRNQLEEIKTYRGDLSLMPDNHRFLHWAQLKIYGWLQCQRLGFSEIKLALVYYNIGSQKETLLSETHSAESLKRNFEDHCARFLAWAEQETAHREARDRMLAELPFPHAAFHSGQRELAEAVYKAAREGRCLMAQAPTGIGKTIGTLFPLLKACPSQKLDKIFYLTAKTSGRRLALDALAGLNEGESVRFLRVLELIARDKACEYPDRACHGASCPLAQGFYDRLPQARAAALRREGVLDKAALRTVALAHGICPYYLSQELARWCDVVVGDYNYYFDLNAMLHGMSVANGWRSAVLADEAHNLIERARMMYTAELDHAGFRFMRQTAPLELKNALTRVERAWAGLRKEQSAAYQVYAEIPDNLLAALQLATAAITDHMAEHPAGIDPSLQSFYFDALQFIRIAELFGQHSIFDITLEAPRGKSRQPDARLCIRNIIPAPFLEPRFAASHATILFSATLSPWHFYVDTLGLPADTVWVDVPSPFSSKQLSVRLVTNISTRFRQRERSLAPIADLMALQYEAQPGNYLGFFSSFDYLQQVSALFRARHPQVPLWEQARRMDEREREQFLERFAIGGRGIGLAVLGGAFAEGIDLTGERLIGAFIATLGLPQINPVNQQIMQRMNASFGAGYEYTYLFPGIRKVVQAAGRVIRTQSDRGVIHLIDDRFAQPEIVNLLPAWWGLDQT